MSAVCVTEKPQPWVGVWAKVSELMHCCVTHTVAFGIAHCLAGSFMH